MFVEAIRGVRGSFRLTRFATYAVQIVLARARESLRSRDLDSVAVLSVIVVASLKVSCVTSREEERAT